ncbi:MAG TPA: methionyl-tRNA formyltransferase [Gordonia sp. (in: high G+C Gram-positive bacteria)]|uniref:methionyl-tRNA formyltransferase n=1 Tax=unclassified Gordonia (in: high G+C Gram-positive bacteria) TaxID=2657482 RepID=UPI0025B8549D|nr:MULTISPECIES: methionyl-tRNA formyltransferase [unclassified Gordonia (in: high G+C Gram-positive bacteria)]HNP56181.1 methionyl-tRNA formyltransferase [Gordonia sp. (in: high G+C Gram-positive bacteria)]HRC50368.1 methionyl-tRNA formyltransferase [Gordonia sp. (in: high G+C Gram-positive bacteria)]
MRVLFAGTPAAAVPSLNALHDSPDHQVVGVLSRPDAVSGRGRKTTRSDVAQRADELGIDVFTPPRLYHNGEVDPEVLAQLNRWAPDCAAVVAYGALIPPALLDLPARGWINLHFSLLPAWRGAGPVQAAIAAGDTVTGASTFQIEAGLDTGPVYGTLTTDIGAGETSGDLLDRLALSGANLLVATLDGIEAGELAPVAQPDHDVSHAPKITVADARVVWARPAHIVDRLIRAHTPDPGAWCAVDTGTDELRLRIGPVRRGIADEPGAPENLSPGELAVTKKAVYVGTADEVVALTWVVPPGKKQMLAADWARGARLEPGQVLR